MSPADTGAAGPGTTPGGYTTRPDTTAPTGAATSHPVLIMGPHATGGQCLLRRLLSSLRHVCLFFPVRARPGLRVLLPHVLGTNLRFALGDGCAPSLPTRTVRPHREEETPNPRPASSPLPLRTGARSPPRGLGHGVQSSHHCPRPVASCLSYSLDVEGGFLPRCVYGLITKLLLYYLKRIRDQSFDQLRITTATTTRQYDSSLKQSDSTFWLNCVPLS